MDFFKCSLICALVLFGSLAVTEGQDSFDKELEDYMEKPFLRLAILEVFAETLNNASTAEDAEDSFMNTVQAYFTFRLSELINEAVEFYENLHEESLKSKKLPEGVNNMVEFVLLDKAPKYVELLQTDIIDFVKEDEILSDQQKAIINRDIPNVVKDINQFVSNLKDLVTKQPEEVEKYDFVSRINPNYVRTEIEMTPKMKCFIKEFMDMVNALPLKIEDSYKELSEIVKEYDGKLKSGSKK